MKKPLTIKGEGLARLAALPRDERAECMLALIDLAQSFGQPHQHRGLGIRKLVKGVFECRGNLRLRFLFLDRSADLYVWMLGDHNDVRAALREI